MFLTHPLSIRVAPNHIARFIPPAPRTVRAQSLFQTNPAVEVLPERDMFALDGPLVFKTKSGIIITIPKGVMTDFASIPKILDWVPWLDINGTSRLAGELHDGGYKLDKTKGKDFWDSILMEACLDLGMSSFQAKSYYYGVHFGGASSFAADQADPDYGSPRAHFVSKETYDAWVASGSQLYS